MMESSPGTDGGDREGKDEGKARVLSRYSRLVAQLRSTARHMIEHELLDESEAHVDGGLECLVLFERHVTRLNEMFPDAGFGDLTLRAPSECPDEDEVGRALGRMLPRADQVLALLEHLRAEEEGWPPGPPMGPRRTVHIRDHGRHPASLGETIRSSVLSSIMPYVSAKVADGLAGHFMDRPGRWMKGAAFHGSPWDAGMDAEAMDILRKVESGEMTPEDAAEWFEDPTSGGDDDDE